MTTKNPEYVFDLQAFALVTTTDTGVSASDLSVDYSSEVATISATSNHVVVNAGWTANETVSYIHTNIKDDSDTSIPVSDTYVYYNNDQYNYYGFASTDTSEATTITLLDGGVVETAGHANSDATITAATLPSSGVAFTNQTVGASVTVSGGGVRDKFVLSGIGNIETDLSNQAKLGLTASGSNLKIDHVSGAEVILTPNTNGSGNATINNQVINGAAISATLNGSGTLTFNGGDEGNDVTIASSADATLGSVDNKQTWNLSSQKLAYNRLEVSGAVSVTGADAAGSYLAVTAGNENPVTFDIVGGRTLVDSVSVDGTVLSGVGAINAVVTKQSDSEMTATAGKVGSLSAGSTGGMASLAAGANAVISVTDAGPAITGVDKLAARGKWVLGDSLQTAELGSDTVAFAAGASTITATSDGTMVQALNFTGGNATLQAVEEHASVSVNGAASWSFDGDSVAAVFDTVGSVSISSAEAVNANLVNGGPKTLSAGENGGADTLVLANGGNVIVDDNVVTAANGLLNGSEWLVRGSSGSDNRTVLVGSRAFTFENATDSVYGALQAVTLNNANAGTSTITGIDSLSGNVTVTHYDGAISNLDVMGTTWNVANDDSETVIFASTGSAASVTANTNSDLSISASADASVQVAIASGNTVRGIFNHVTVTAHDDESPFGIQFEASDTAAGVAGINGLNSAATIRGDNHVLINDTFDINKAGASNSALANNIQFTLGSGDMTVKNVVSGDNYNGTGGRIFYDVTSSVSAGGNVNITINSATATINATTDSAISNVYVISDGTGDSAIETIGGVKLNDTITSVTDRNFTVVYDTSSINSDTEYTMLVNGAGITVDGADLVGDNSTIGVNVDNSGSKPVVSLSSGVISNGATVTVGAGVYNVGGNAAVTVNDDIGYLYFDANNGSVTAEDFSVAEVRTRREGAIGNLVEANSDNTVHAFNDFYNAYYPNSSGYGFIGSSINSTVAGYASVTTSAPSLGAVSGGINIYAANASLNGSGTAGYPNSITLQSFVANPINVQHYEGLISGTATLNNAVIDVSGGNNTLVAIGVDGSNFSTNHTILGSARQSTLVVGANATGDNVVQAGNGGNYIYHNTNNGAKASLFGGTGADTIYASTGDHVEGGGGRDFFYDANAIEISDYNFDDGDIIIATKLSASTPLTPDNIQFSGNRVSIASGAEITVGAMADYDEATATRAVIANAGNDTTSTKFAIWAGNYESSLDASNFTKSAYMFSQMNEGRADTIIGSTFADTIYAGGNDFVDGGTGNDYIQLYGDSGQNGATVVLTEGGNIVNGWSTGFDNSAGSNILAADALSLNFRTRQDQIIAYSGSSSITFSDLSVSSAADFLVGESKVTFIKNGQIATVSSNDDIANYYKAERAGGISVGSGVTTEFTVSLGSDQFASVNSLYLENESKATVYGSNANETISVIGSNDNGARKYVAAGGGNDTIYSGGNASSVAGNFFYFGTYNNYTYSSGNNDLYNYSFYKSTDADYSTSDLIYLGASSNYSSLSVNADRAEIALTDDTKVRIHGDGAFSNTDNKIVRIQFGDDEKIYNTKLGMTSSVNAFTYDGVTDLYLGNTGRGRDTLNVASDLGNVNIWLDDKNLDKNTYAGVGLINAGNVADTKLTLAGSGSNNTIVSGGNNTSTSLWGGGGESNSLIGGNGEDTFFYFKQYGYTDNDGNFHSSNDKIDRVDSNDLIWLYDVQLSDIDADKTSIASNQITVGLTNGSSIVVTNMSQETNFRLSNGNGGWQDVKAVNRGNNRYWE